MAVEELLADAPKAPEAFESPKLVSVNAVVFVFWLLLLTCLWLSIVFVRSISISMGFFERSSPAAKGGPLTANAIATVVIMIFFIATSSQSEINKYVARKHLYKRGVTTSFLVPALWNALVQLGCIHNPSERA